MSTKLINAATSDGYTREATRQQPFTSVITVQIANAAVLCQLDLDEHGQGLWEEEERFLAPTIGTLARRCGGIRFKSALAGAPARVSCELLDESDLSGQGLDALSQFTGTISAAGGVGAAVNIGTVALGSFPPPSPNDGDVYFLILPASFDPIGGNPIHWLVQYDVAAGVWHVSGPPLTNRVLTLEALNVASNTWGNLGIDGPSVTIPRPGSYSLRWGAKTGAGGVSDVAVTLGNVNGAEPFLTVPSGNNTGAMGDVRTLAANDAPKLRYRSTSGAGIATFSDRWLEALPRTIT